MIALVCLLAAALAAPLQEAVPPDAGAADDLVEKLVKRIQEDLGEVDRQLEQAADENDPAAQLAAAREAHVRAIADLEKLIRQVKYKRGGGGGGGGQGGEGGKSSSTDPRSADNRSEAEQAQSPQEQQGKQGSKDGKPSGPGGNKPTAGQPNPSAGQQKDARSPPPPAATSDFLRHDTDARWGMLPPKLQERLMNLHVDDVPERYRSWLEAYVRELNRRDTAGGAP